MAVEWTLGQSFPTLGARIVYAYLASFPDFSPWGTAVSAESQQHMHQFLQAAVERIYQDPKQIGITDEPDRCFRERWILNNKEPELHDAMIRVQNKFFDWVGVLLKLGICGAIRGNELVVAKSAWKITGKTIDLLTQSGLQSESQPDAVVFRCTEYPALFPAWKMRLAISPEGQIKTQYLTSFLFGVFAERTYRATEMFGRLHREPAQLARLEAFFEAQGFHLTTDTRDLRVVWDREYPGKERGYLKINFRWRDRLQMNYEFRVPGYRQLMTQYEQLPLPIQGLCFSRMKVCNSCGYCTQTDKSGQRLRLAMPLTWQGETALKCPLYPWFNWNELDEYAFEGMAYLFTMAEKCLVK